MTVEFLPHLHFSIGNERNPSALGKISTISGYFLRTISFTSIKIKIYGTIVINISKLSVIQKCLPVFSIIINKEV
jgi:hypothetical protein